MGTILVAVVFAAATAIPSAPQIARSQAGDRGPSADVSSVTSERGPRERAQHAGDMRRASEYPNDWFGLQRAFPNSTIPQERWEMAVAQARVDRAAGRPSISSELLKWQPA